MMHNGCYPDKKTCYENMVALLEKHKDLFDELIINRDISLKYQSKVETMITTEDAAMLAIISSLREKDFPLKFKEKFKISKAG